MFYEYKVFFSGTQLICKWCCSSIFIVNYDIWNVYFYSKSYSYQVYLRKNWWKTGKHLKVTTSASLAGSVLLYKYLWRYLSLLGNILNVNFFLVIKLWLVKLKAIELFGISYVNFTMLQNIFFKKRGFSSYHFTSYQHLKGCLFSPTQFLMIFGCRKCYSGRLEENQCISVIWFFKAKG